MEHPPDDKEALYIQACLGYQLFPDQALPVAPAGLDWERLFALLKRHKLAAYFYILRSVLGSDWPAEFCEWLRKINYMFSLYNGQRAAFIAQVLSALRAAKVDVIVLKGWAFIQTIYAGDYSARFCIDIDIVVRPDDSAKAAGILRGLGYQPVDESWPGYAQRYLGAQTYLSSQENLPLQIGFHWGLLSKPSYDPDQVDMDGLFSRARSLNVAGVNVLELSFEDQIVYGCVHLGLHHKYDEGLYFYYDIGALIRRAGSDLDWKAMIQCAREWYCVIPLQRVLLSLERFWPGLIPQAALEEIIQLSPIFKERFVNLWIERTRGRASFDHLLFWIVTPGLKRKFEIAFQDIFPSPAYMQKRYGPAPAGFWPILYFLRLFRSFQLMRKSL